MDCNSFGDEFFNGWIVLGAKIEGSLVMAPGQFDQGRGPAKVKHRDWKNDPANGMPREAAEAAKKEAQR